MAHRDRKVVAPQIRWGTGLSLRRRSTVVSDQTGVTSRYDPRRMVRRPGGRTLGRGPGCRHVLDALVSGRSLTSGRQR